jgi:hypothetical protein
MKEGKKRLNFLRRHKTEDVKQIKKVMLPCPFCGKDGYTAQMGAWKYKAMCPTDGCVLLPSGVERFFTSEENAIKFWNTRR